MLLRKLSIRLGINLGLYIGICIGFIVAELITLAEYYLLSFRVTQLVTASIALILSSILVIGIIIRMQNKHLLATDQVCTCRYRSSLYVDCKKCALVLENNSPKKNQQADI